MKKVAFLSFDWDYKIVSEYYLGLQDHLPDRGDVQVVIFNAFGSYYVSHHPKQSTLEVFSLFDPRDYDGILIQGNRTWPPEMRQELVDRAVALDKPVVSINYDLAGAHTVSTNNYQEEYELVSRVLRERDCKRPAFVNGLKTSVEAQDRMRGFSDACRDAGFEDPHIYQANWQMEAGVLTAKRMLRRPNDLPDVICCCNDDLAVGVQETLQAAGVRVPDDVMVTGFDNREVSQQTSPRVTTVDRDYRTIAVTALTMLQQLMDGKEIPEHVFSPAQHILAESCGYTSQPDAERMSAQRSSDEALKRFYSILGDFQNAVLSADSLYAVLENCETFASELDCPDVFLSLDDACLKHDSLLESTSHSPVSHLVARRGRTSTLACDSAHVYASYPTAKLLPPETPLTHALYVVSPLRRNETCVGLIVTEGVPTALRYGFNAFFLTVLSSAIVAARKSELLQAVSEELEGLKA